MRDSFNRILRQPNTRCVFLGFDESLDLTMALALATTTFPVLFFSCAIASSLSYNWKKSTQFSCKKIITCETGKE